MTTTKLEELRNFKYCISRICETDVSNDAAFEASNLSIFSLITWTFKSFCEVDTQIVLISVFSISNYCLPNQLTHVLLKTWLVEDLWKNNKE